MAHRRLCLSNLTLMMREDEIHATTVDIELLAEIFSSHGSALAVPAGEAFAPRRWPAHDVLGLCLLPQCEVGLMAFLPHPVELATGILDILKGASAEDAVLILLVVGLDVEVDTAVGLVGEATVENLLHELLLFDDMSGGTGLYRWTQHSHGIHSLMVAPCVVLCYLHGLELLEACLLGNLVLALIGIVLEMTYIGDIAHVPYLITKMAQVAEEHIEGDSGAGMAQMGVAIDGRSADVHAHIGGM